MISEKMKPPVSNDSIIRAVFEEGRRLAAVHSTEDVYGFNLGNPNVPAPMEVNLAIHDILKEGEPTFVHDYMSSAGYRDIGQAMVESLSRCSGARLHQNNILMTMGAVSGLNVTLKTLLNPEDEITAPAPYSVEYDDYVRNYDGNLVVILPDTMDFESSLIKFEQKINTRTRTIAIGTLNNPTRIMHSLETLTKVADIMQVEEGELGTTIALLFDELYRRLAYSGVEISYVTNVYDSTVICYSYSKSLSLPGGCIDYFVIPDALEDNGEMFNAATIANRTLGCVGAPSLVQRVIMHCLDAKVNPEVYDRNRNLLYNGLEDLGSECIEPQDTFYLFVKSSETDEGKFCENRKEYDILMVPGTSFAYPGYVRISYCVSCERIGRSFPASVKVAMGCGLKK